jgi:hypothetical protein
MITKLDIDKLCAQIEKVKNPSEKVMDKLKSFGIKVQISDKANSKEGLERLVGNLKDLDSYLQSLRDMNLKKVLVLPRLETNLISIPFFTDTSPSTEEDFI